MLTSAPAFTM